MSAMNKMLKWIGIAEEDDEEFFDTETDMDEAVEPAMPLGRKAKVSSISTKSQQIWLG